jgi:hypothetical protein
MSSLLNWHGTYPLYLCFPHHYEYLRGLAALGQDAIGANLGDCTGSNLGHS